MEEEVLGEGRGILQGLDLLAGMARL